MGNPELRRAILRYSDSPGEDLEAEGEANLCGKGNTGLPFGLCKKYGVSLPSNATPYDAWEALKKRTGMSPQDFYDKLEQEQKEKKNQTDSDANSEDIEKCKDFDELANYFHAKYGLSIDKSVKGLDYDSVHTALKGVDRTMQEFPQARKTLRGITVDSGGIMCTKLSGEICFNPKWFRQGSPAAEDRIRNLSESKFFPKNAGVFYAGAHEMGHILELALIQRRYPNGGGTLAWVKCELAQEIVFEACKKVQQHTKQNFYDIRAEVSRYASDKKYSVSETLAECVSDYIINRENSARLSHEVWKILKKELG